MTLATTSGFAPVPIDREAILRSLNINARDPKHQAMLLVCERYGLDPVLKHAVIISGNVYVTRDGLLHVAHQTDRLDGIVVDDEGETDTEWWAKVTVYVKGQSHGYTYRGRYPKNGQQKRYGPEMAVKVAEVMALRRAFGVTGIPTIEEQWDKSDQQAIERPSAPPLPAEVSGGGEPVPPPAPSPGVRTGGVEGHQSARPDDRVAGSSAPSVTPSGVSPVPGGETPAPPATSTLLDVGAVEQTALAHGAAPAGPDIAATPSTRKRGGSGGDHGAGQPPPQEEGPHDGHVEAQDPLPAPKDSLKAINPRAYSSLNRKCRALHGEHGSPDKDTAAAQWEALAWAESGGRTTHLGELTPDEASRFRTRMVDVAEGRATWAESDDPKFLGWTLTYREAS